MNVFYAEKNAMCGKVKCWFYTLGRSFKGVPHASAVEIKIYIKGNHIANKHLLIVILLVTNLIYFFRIGEKLTTTSANHNPTLRSGFATRSKIWRRSLDCK